MKKSDYKKSIIILPLIVITALLAWLVLAAPGNGVKIIAPSNGVFINASNSGNMLFNATYTNLTDANDPLNASFYVNFTGAGTWHLVGNSTSCVVATVGNLSCSATLNASRTHNATMLPDGYYSVNASVWNGTTQVYMANAANMTTYLIDRVGPSSANKTGISSWSNHSTKGSVGNLTLNLSAADSTSSITAVLFQIWNTTVLNATLKGVREGTTSYWSTSVNTSHFPDGKYNITFFVNDTANNFNATANSTVTASLRTTLTEITFDNTKPTPSSSCTSTNIDTGDAYPCSCAGTDALSGVSSADSSSTSPQGTGTQTSSGTFTHTCTVTDRAGNVQADSSLTYTVSEAAFNGGSNSPGGGSSPGGNTGGSTGTNGTGSTPGSTTGTQGPGTGPGASGQGNQPGASGASGGLSAGVIFAIILAAVVVVVIVVMLRKKSAVSAK